jgi:hypothetical protein
MSDQKCERCGNDKHRGRCKGAGKARKVKSLEEVVERRTAPKPVKLNGHLEVPSGLGFRASVEDDLVCIEQDRPPDDEGVVYTHSLTLAPHEAAQLASWLAARSQA